MDDLFGAGLPLYMRDHFPIATVSVVLSVYGYVLDLIGYRIYAKVMNTEIESLELILEKLN